MLLKEDFVEAGGGFLCKRTVAINSGSTRRGARFVN